MAFTKSFALLAAILLVITIVPPLAEQLFKLKSKSKTSAYISHSILIALAIFLLFTPYTFFGVFGLVVGVGGIISTHFKDVKSEKWNLRFDYIKNGSYALVIAWLLAKIWMPLGVIKSVGYNFLFVVVIMGTLIGLFYVVIHFYENILRFLLRVRYLFILGVSSLLFSGFMVFMNTGEEFMPALNEGSFLLMPTAMPHAGMEMNEKNLRLLDMSVTAIPEVEMVVGKAGRVSSSLDPAPMSMYENIILYKSEYKTDEDGRRIRFKINDNDEYIYDEKGKLIPDKKGQYFRQWREHIHSPDDIWEEIVNATKIPGLTSAPKLQPIETRLVMLQTGMRAPMGIKVKGTDLKVIEAFGLELEKLLKEVEGVKIPAVFAERIVGKPYMMLDIKRDEISRHGLSIVDVQNQIQTAIGGMIMTSTVEGRER